MNALAALLLFIPFLFLIFTANIAERSANGRIVQYMLLLLTNAGLLFIGFMLLMVGALTLVPGYLDSVSRQAGEAQTAALRDVNWGAAGAWLTLGALAGMAALAPPVRRLSARVFHIEPNSMVHATALSLSATVVGANLSQTVLTMGLLNGQLEGQNLGMTYLDILIFPMLVLSLAALLGVGWLSRRNWEGIVERLALTPPTARQMGAAVVTVGLLFALSAGTDRVWEALDPVTYKAIGGLSNAMMGNFTGLAGAFAIGATAAIGEELFFRGAYQPRFGLVFTSAFFALFHVQYGLTPATLLVFVVGLIIGSFRARGAPLIVCIFIHFAYNFLSVLLST